MHSNSLCIIHRGNKKDIPAGAWIDRQFNAKVPIRSIQIFGANFSSLLNKCWFKFNEIFGKENGTKSIENFTNESEIRMQQTGLCSEQFIVMSRGKSSTIYQAHHFQRRHFWLLSIEEREQKRANDKWKWVNKLVDKLPLSEYTLFIHAWSVKMGLLCLAFRTLFDVSHCSVLLISIDFYVKECSFVAECVVKCMKHYHNVSHFIWLSIIYHHYCQRTLVWQPHTKIALEK